MTLSKTGWPSLKCDDFSTCNVPRFGRPKESAPLPKFIEQIDELILEHRRISAKSIAEQLGISRERVGSIIHKDFDMRNLSAKLVPKCLNVDQKRQRCQSSEEWLVFFLGDPNDLLSGAIGDHWRNLLISLLTGDKATLDELAA